MGDNPFQHPNVLAVLAAFPGAQIEFYRPKEEIAMDFTPSKGATFAEAFQALIDEAMETAHLEQPQRDYLGGSRLGEECDRRLGYEWTLAAKDPGRNFAGKTLRIFDMGHDGEERMAAYLRLAGFTLLTEKADGGQFGFYVCSDPETGRARIAGHLDGVFTDGPADLPTLGLGEIRFPCLWENKALGGKSWDKTLKQGVERSKPVYYAQMQTYMAYMGLHENPALFTALNRDTGAIYAELVPFKVEAAQAASDRGVRVVTARSPEDLPRIARERTDYRCRFCEYQDRCWSAPDQQPQGVATPSWLPPA